MFDSLQPTAYSLQPAACPEDRLLLLLCRGQVSAEQEAEARQLLLQPAVSSPQPTAYSLQPAVSSPQPTAYSLQPAVSRPQPTAYSLQPDFWSRLIARALEQEILPLFRRNLETLGFPGVPADARARMNDLCRANTARQLFLVQELRRLLRLLDSAGIPAIPLKGPWLAQRLYGDYTLRACADLDLMVPPDRAVDAARVLTADGYEGCFPLDFFARHLVGGGIEYCLSKRGSPRCTVDLHWWLLRGGASDRRAVDDLWNEARPCTIFGAPAYSLTPEWELLF
ncbi:MAG: nucleotidyltransferase family protein, partial [Acidobacteria bacterium]|nr:nucleotidyltransferase family protein [Acidobacteriota bacterium]